MLVKEAPCRMIFFKSHVPIIALGKPHAVIVMSFVVPLAQIDESH